MKNLIFILLFISCAKMSYMAEQGIGQVALEWNGRSNDKVLKDPKVKKEYKDKIRLIEKAKNYFYNYYGLKKNSIYSQTTFLDQPAVSYLVVHSPKDKVQAMNSCFPIAGCFPYQGFFDRESALEFKKDKEAQGFQTFMRPVFAYSTLNHPLIPFSDNILSSFFHFKDRQLVNLVFHELVHTVIFVKDEAQFNENLAQFISDAMMIEYLNLDNEFFEDLKATKLKRKLMNENIVLATKRLNDKYKQGGNKSEYTLNNFIRNDFLPSMKKLCRDEKIKACWPLKAKWNNARFAAFRTYEAKRSEIETIFKDYNLSLKDFLHKLIKLEDEFDYETSFIEYLKKKGK